MKFKFLALITVLSILENGCAGEYVTPDFSDKTAPTIRWQLRHTLDLICPEDGTIRHFETSDCEACDILADKNYQIRYYKNEYCTIWVCAEDNESGIKNIDVKQCDNKGCTFFKKEQCPCESCTYPNCGSTIKGDMRPISNKYPKLFCVPFFVDTKQTCLDRGLPVIFKVEVTNNAGKKSFASLKICETTFLDYNCIDSPSWNEIIPF